MKHFLFFLLGSCLATSIFGQSVPIYLYFASHNETNDQSFHGLDYANSSDYTTMKGYVQQVCDSIIKYDAKYEMMLESNFILGCLANESAATNPNDIIEWADNHPNIEVQPHNHFKPMPPNANPYNYADLVHLLDSCGLSSHSEVMGGFIWRNFTIPVTVSEDWTQWQVPKAGFTFSTYSWQPTLLWGGGSPNHVDDYNAYGVWKPKAATSADFGTHDTTKALVNFGNGCGDDFVLWDTTTARLMAYRIMNFADSVNLHFAGTPNAFFNMKVMLNFRHFPSVGYIDKIGEILRTIKPYIDSHKIEYKGIMETYQIWQTLHPNPADYFATKCENTVIISDTIPSIYATAIVQPLKTKVSISPNPVQDKLICQVEKPLTTNVKVSVRNSLGQELPTSFTLDNDYQLTLAVNALPSGVYILNIENTTLKFIKQ